LPFGAFPSAFGRIGAFFPVASTLERRIAAGYNVPDARDRLRSTPKLSHEEIRS
jgi:hypothetical protein